MRKRFNFCSVATGFAAISLLPLGMSVKAELTRICQFDPDLGVPNQLGRRSYLTIAEEDGNTTFLFEQFPSSMRV